MMHTLADMVFENFDPAWFWLLAAAGSVLVLWLTYRGIYQRSGRRLTWTLFALRTAGVLILLVAITKPAWRHVIEQTHRPQVAVIVDDSQSMTHPHPAEGEHWRPRFQLARQWLADSPAGEALRENFEVKLFDVTGRPLDHLPDEPNREQTDLLRAVRNVGRQVRGRHTPAVLLISDGSDTTGRRNFMTLGDEAAPPIYALGFGQPAAGERMPFDLAVEAVDAPSRTLVHNAVAVKVRVSKDGGGAIDMPLQIERAGQTLTTQRIALPAGETEKTFTVNYTADQAGDFVLTARLPAQPAERSSRNNARMFKLRVDAEPIRALYVEGVLRPEYKYLRERLSEDPDIDLITFVRSASPDQASTAGVLLGGELVSEDRLEKIDVILLGDFEARMLDEPTYARLRDWVEDGGGLMVLGGYLNLADGGLGRTPLADVLPVELDPSGIQHVDEPFTFSLTAEGRRHPALTITGDMARDAQLWQTTPRLKGITAVRGAKPGATVLARHPQMNPMDEEGRGYVVLATQPYGKGVCAVLTADTTWRWSRLARLTGRTDTLYIRFWSQMARWLAQRDIASDRTALTVTTDAASYERGRRVGISVRRNPAVMLPGGEADTTDLELAVVTPDGRTASLSPNADPVNPNLWTASYFPDRGGRFEVTARLLRTGDDGGQDVANQVSEFFVEGSQLELDDPSTHPVILRQIAQNTGGRYAEISDRQQAVDMIEELPTTPRVTYEARTSDVWNSPGLFILFLILVTFEWVVRRRNRLV